MGDWRTLHFFDAEKYKKEIIPLVRQTENYLSTFLNKNRLERFGNSSLLNQSFVNDTASFISELKDDLSIHSDLFDIQEHKKDENYADFIQRRNIDYDSFINSKSQILEFFKFILTETIFSNVADFNPHFILGKRLFESYVKFEKGALAAELISNITFSKQGSVLNVYDCGIINWLTKEEVELLILEEDKIFNSGGESIDYVIEFKQFLRMAIENNCGLISLRNPRENDLSKLKPKNSSNELLTEKEGYNYIITTKNERNSSFD